MDSCKKTAFRMLFVIATPNLIRRAARLLQEELVPVQYVLQAQGTATSSIMDMFGLDGVKKKLLLSMMPKECADRMLKRLRKDLHLGMPNTGIAFTVAVSGCSGRAVSLMEGMQEQEESALRRDEWDKMENAYSAIMAIVNQGFSEDVMNAARPMGATGGTVFHSRRISSEEAMKFWGISIQQERETVLILAAKEAKKGIMQAIGEKCGMKSEAQGIVLSLPVDEIIGLNE